MIGCNSFFPFKYHHNIFCVDFFPATIFSESNLYAHLFSFRRDIANMLGYENFAQMSMETKMAGTVENVISMIER